MSENLIFSVKPKSKGVYTITLIEDGDKTQYELSEGTYREIGSPLSGYFMDDGAYEVMRDEDERRRALKRALRVLECADKSKSALYLKLLSLGFSKEISKSTVEECVRLGYVNEGRTVERMVLSLATRDLLGQKKIYAKLLSRGYSSSVISKAISSLTQSGEIDFEEIKQQLILKKQPKDEEQTRILLFKHGFIYD